MPEKGDKEVKAKEKRIAKDEAVKPNDAARVRRDAETKRTEIERAIKTSKTKK